MPIKTILLAEDDPYIRLLAELSLRRQGFDVQTASDGAEALEIAARESFDLIVLDGQMPKVDGAEVCRRLKLDPRTAKVPVIFLSARSQGSEASQAMAAGAIGYIRKPFDALTLGAELLAICEGHRP